MDIDFTQLLESEHPELVMEQARPFTELMMRYSCALREIQTKFQVLDDEFSVRYNRNPVESIKTRLKTPQSILEKLKRRDLPLTLQSIRDNLHDVAGIRIICSFPDDIYSLAEMLTRQDDITLIQVKDYIKKPKPNGYRSLHLIVEVPIFLSRTKELMRVEVQLRTIAMDLWASIEFKLQYKRGTPNTDALRMELKECAESIAYLDLRMQAIMRHIEEED